MSTNIVYFNLRLRVAGMYASLTKSNKKRKLHSKRKGAKNIVLTKTYLKPKAVLARPENSPQETNPDRNQWVHHKLASANVIIASRVYQILLNQILETTIAPLIYLYFFKSRSEQTTNYIAWDSPKINNLFCVR